MGDGTRRALVTGASAGIGRACAEELHAAGWAVTGASRRGTTSGGWAGLVMDVDDDDSVRAGVAGMLAAGGRIDALIASAGWGLAGAVEQCTIGEAKAQLETNFWGCVRVLQQVLPAMRAQGGGRIVLMSSIGGVIGIPFQAFYSALRMQPGRRTRPAGAQPMVVPPSKPFGMAESFFSALNSLVAWVLFHSTESPAFV
jgi:NADP-dependent 3-hydroxy acid dehydrogenase YdfG